MRRASKGDCIYFQRVMGNRIYDNRAYRIIASTWSRFTCRRLNDIQDINLIEVSRFSAPEGMDGGYNIMSPGWAFAYALNCLKLYDIPYDEKLHYVFTWFNAASYELDSRSGLYKEPVPQKAWWCRNLGDVQRALDFAARYGGTDGSHHKAWVIDQMVRALTGSMAAYEKLVAEARAGVEGPETYSWDVGIPP